MSQPIPEPEPVTERESESLPPFVKPNPRANGRTEAKPRKPRGPLARAIIGPEGPPKPPRVPTMGRRGQFERPLTELYVSVGTLMMPFDPVCGQTVIQQAEACAKSLDELAYQNEAVRRALTMLLTTSAWGAVVAAHLPIIMAVAMHHSPKLQERMASGLGDVVETMMKNQGDTKE